MSRWERTRITKGKKPKTQDIAISVFDHHLSKQLLLMYCLESVVLLAKERSKVNAGVARTKHPCTRPSSPLINWMALNRSLNLYSPHLSN